MPRPASAPSPVYMERGDGGEDLLQEGGENPIQGGLKGKKKKKGGKTLEPHGGGRGFLDKQKSKIPLAGRGKLSEKDAN